MYNQSNRDLWHNCKRNKRNNNDNTPLHLNASRSTLQRGVEAPLLITPVHLENSKEQQKGIPIKRESNPKNSDNHNLA